VYSRVVNGKKLTIRPSGWAYDNTFVLMDEETGSLWYPDWRGLKGIQGDHFKKRLRRIKSEDTKWGNWKKKHPNSRILK
jgi:hypothetical protein